MTKKARYITVFTMYGIVALAALIINTIASQKSVDLETLNNIAVFCFFTTLSHIAIFLFFDVLADSDSGFLNLLRIAVLIIGAAAFLFSAFMCFVILSDLKETDNAFLSALVTFWPVAVALSFSIHRKAVHGEGMKSMAVFAFPISLLAGYVAVLPLSFIAIAIKPMLVNMLIIIVYFVLIILISKGLLGKAFVGLGSIFEVAFEEIASSPKTLKVNKSSYVGGGERMNFTEVHKYLADELQGWARSFSYNQSIASSYSDSSVYTAAWESKPSVRREFFGGIIISGTVKIRIDKSYIDKASEIEDNINY